jgi:hypothetical protein
MFGMVIEAAGVSGSAHDTGALPALGDIPGCARAHDFFTKLINHAYYTVSKHLLADMSPPGKLCAIYTHREFVVGMLCALAQSGFADGLKCYDITFALEALQFQSDYQGPFEAEYHNRRC